MPQINLLKQQQTENGLMLLLPSILVKILLIILAGVIAYYVWTFLQINKAENLILEAQRRIQAQKTEIDSVPNKDELYTRQGQLNELKQLIGTQLFWSQVMPALAEVTLKGVTYSQLSMNTEGYVNLTLNVKNLTELERFLSAFDRPEVYKNFSEVKIGPARETRLPNGGTGYMVVDAKIKFNPEILKYKK